MIGLNTEERHAVKSIVNIFRKEFPTAFRHNKKPTKTQRVEMNRFSKIIGK